MENFGSYLRQERELRGITLEEISQETRVNLRYLKALEAESYHQLPPKPFVKGFLDAYSKFLGMDTHEVRLRYEQVLLEENQWREAGEKTGADAVTVSRPSKNQQHWKNWVIYIGLALAVTSFFSVQWFLDSTDHGEVMEPALPALDQKPVPAVGADLAGPALQATGPPPAPAGAAAIRVLVRAEEATWVSAAADGGEETKWTVQAGEHRELTARERIVLSLGDAGAVKLTVNGRELGFVGLKGEVKKGLLFKAETE